MKTLLTTAFILVLLYNVKSQNLVVGFTDPDEVVNVNAGSFTYDTVFLLNNATLNISNQTHFIVNDIVAILGKSELNVENSYFEVNAVFSLQDSATVLIKDSLNLSCDVYVSDNATLSIDRAQVSIPMTYKGEFSIYGTNKSSFRINNSNLNLGAGALGGRFSDNATFIQVNNQYKSSMLPMTLSLAGNSITSVDSCSGGMEFVIAEQADVSIQNSNFFMIWYTFTDGNIVEFNYPPPNSTSLPGASHIAGDYQFSNALSNVSGIDFNVSIQSTDGIFWGIISNKNSDVTVNNSSILACGFYFDEMSSAIASGYVNAQTYTNYSSAFSDRSFTVNNTSVNAWNFYASDTSEIIISNSIYGESLGFAHGVTKVYNSTCDGTGGYFGGQQDSKTYVYSSQIIRKSGTAQIINFQDNSKAWMYHSDIVGDIVLSGNSQLYFGNTQYTSAPITNQNSYFAETWVDSIKNVSAGVSIPITGNVRGINGASSSSDITRYIVEYSLPDSSDITLIKDTTATSFDISNGTLSYWKTQGLSAGNYLIWLTIFVDGDTAISCNREVVLGEITSIIENNTGDHIYVYPNPTTGLITIKGENILTTKILTISGSEVYTGTSPDLNLMHLPGGIYLARIETKERVIIKRLMLH